MKFAAILVLGVVATLSACSRAPELSAQAQAGQPIVRAIEQYHTEMGTYPGALSDLVPKYLATAPDVPDESKSKFTGWDYRHVTNGAVASYALRYYMGKGGVEYEPPNWIGNDEGHRTVIFSNAK